MSNNIAEQKETIGIYILTYNCARTPIQPNIFAPYLFHALPPTSAASNPELLVLCLQELAPISYAFLGGSFLEPYFGRWRECVRRAGEKTRGNGDGKGYVNVVTRNVGMTGIMVFAREDVVGRVGGMRTAGVGVGVAQMGNKGAVGVRLGVQAGLGDDGQEGDGEMEFTFVSAHLAPMEDGLERRNEDFKSIVKGLVFVADDEDSRKRVARGEGEEEEDAPLLQGNDPSQQEMNKTSESGMYSPSSSSHLFFAGDLNYRTSLLRPSPQDVDEKFPRPTTNKADPRHFQQLLAEDQLMAQVKAGKTLHGLSEAPITFPPTYKYDNDGSKAVMFEQGEQEDQDGEEDRRHWSWARHRWPSWCDRIFFSNDRGSSSDVAVTSLRYTSLPLFATSDHRPVALFATVASKVVLTPQGSRGEAGGNTSGAPSSIDREWRSRRAQARKKELVVGLLAYLALTWEGNGLLLATTIGVVGGWLIIRSLLMA